jgi:hypothetical protein
MMVKEGTRREEMTRWGARCEEYLDVLYVRGWHGVVARTARITMFRRLNDDKPRRSDMKLAVFLTLYGHMILLTEAKTDLRGK